MQKLIVDKIKQIDKTIIIIALLLIPHLEPEYFNATNHFLDKIYNIFKIITALIAIYLFIRDKRDMKIFAFILPYYIVFFISTFINNGDFSTLIVNTVSVISVCIIICWGLKDVTACLKAIVLDITILLIINLICIFLYPDGMYYLGGVSNYWLLGYDNTFIFLIIPAISFSMLLSNIGGEKMNYISWFVIILSTVTIIKIWSATSLIAIFIFGCFIFLNKVDKMPKYLTLMNVLIGSILANIGIVVFKIQNMFSFIIINLLHKKTTLSGRDNIWEICIKYIKEQPLLGAGCEYSEFRITKFIYKDFTFVHSHNFLLNIIYETGVIGLIAFLALIFVIAKRMYEYRDNILTKIITISFLAYLLVFIMDSDAKPIGFYMLIVVGYYINILIKEGRIRLYK